LGQTNSFVFQINGKAGHRTYAKRALMKIPSLEEYEQRAA
jgi:hypothetical protein